ncbi:hypothetical protein LCGC14_2017330 [marine sediment metagenome]|uniref:Rubredoxin-like domain-containing protein n=1 Tax=marine sediment metagenome TaxID=412755 RepID=A0A0F9EYL4_9ZZZZ
MIAVNYLNQVIREIKMTVEDYYRNFTCPVCGMWIPNDNIAGNCPHCGAAGFKELEPINKLQENK